MKLVCNEVLLETVIEYYNRRDEVCPWEGELYQRNIDSLIDTITPRLKSFASIAVDELSDDPDFSISSFSDPGHYFCIVGSGDFDSMSKGLEVISTALKELDLSIIICLDCGVYYYCDRFGNYFLDPNDSEPEHLAEIWGIPLDVLESRSPDVELHYENLTKELTKRST